MHERMMRFGGALFLAGVLALTGCQGDDGDMGPQGPQGPAGPVGDPGQDGQDGKDGRDWTETAKVESCSVCHQKVGEHHQAVYNQYTDKATLKASILDVSSVDNGDGTYTSTMTFEVTLGGAPVTDLSVLKQKRYVAIQYDDELGFVTETAITYGNPAPVAGQPGRFTVTAPAAKMAPENENAFAYVYFAAGTPIVEPKGHYQLYPEVVNVAKKFGDWDYVSAANVEGCEKCHGKPYQKHGYRGAVDEAGELNDMTICKGCHTDQRGGTDHIFQIFADDPAAAKALLDAANGGDPDYTPEQLAKYDYYATVMQDTHQSHAMEFAYPQSMANCVACHEGKLDRIFDNKFLTLPTCRSCHPVTGPATHPDWLAKRAPPLLQIMPQTTSSGAPRTYHQNLYANGGNTANCAGCHDGAFAGWHNGGYDKKIYTAAGVRYADQIKAEITDVELDGSVLTIEFSVPATAGVTVSPVVVVSLYGYDTKDFLASGHSVAGLEGQFGDDDPDAMPVTAGASAGTFVATADLSKWARYAEALANGSLKRVEIAILPHAYVGTGADQFEVAVTGVSKTFDLVAKEIVPDDEAYGRDIVAVEKCNACHDALGVTFHNPAYGSAGVVGCRVCHTNLSGGSHLEMQSRNIDSYVHAIHSMQYFDLGKTVRNSNPPRPAIDYSDPVQALGYDHHIESTYPNFTTLNCESCHNPGKYNVPDQSRSLPGLQSPAADAEGVSNYPRSIGAIPSYVTGPASRACGGCHRAVLINEDAAGELAAFNAHVASFGTLLVNGTGVLDATIEEIMAQFK